MWHSVSLFWVSTRLVVSFFFPSSLLCPAHWMASLRSIGIKKENRRSESGSEWKLYTNCIELKRFVRERDNILFGNYTKHSSHTREIRCKFELREEKSQLALCLNKAGERSTTIVGRERSFSFLEDPLLLSPSFLLLFQPRENSSHMIHPSSFPLVVHCADTGRGGGTLTLPFRENWKRRRSPARQKNEVKTFTKCFLKQKRFPSIFMVRMTVTNFCRTSQLEVLILTYAWWLSPGEDWGGAGLLIFESFSRRRIELIGTLPLYIYGKWRVWAKWFFPSRR